MFLHLSVIMSTGVSASVHSGIHPGQTPPWADNPCPVHAGIHSAQCMATAADGTHPTGMHSCYY